MSPTDVADSGRISIATAEAGPLAAGATWLARRERWLWLAATLALFADVVTTLLGLHAGLAEGNPVVSSALADFGVPGFLTIKAGALVLAYGIRIVLPQFRVAIPLGVTVPWTAVALSNVVLLLFVA